MTNEEKAERLEELARFQDYRANLHYAKGDTHDTFGFPNASKASHTTADLASSDAALLREAAQLMRERDKRSLLTGPDWKTMYEAQERDMAAVWKVLEEAMSLLRKLIDEARGAK